METSTHTSQTLDRGLQVMETLAATSHDMTIAEIATAIDVHRTIAHRLVATLHQRQFVSRTSLGRYRLGTRVVCLAASLGGELRAIARPPLTALSAEIDETVHLVVLSEANVLFIDAYESSKTLRVASRMGRLLPAHATSVGKVLLSALSDLELRNLYPSAKLDKTAPNTITSRAKLFKLLNTVRLTGYATSTEESEEGVGSVGVPIVDRNGAVRAALSIAAPISRLTARTLPRMIDAARKTAKKISDQL
jgi:DNA-binding IclR family transcriptional regulator